MYQSIILNDDCFNCSTRSTIEQEVLFNSTANNQSINKTLTVPSQPLFTIVLNQVDMVVRISACLIFISYFLMVFFMKDLRKSSLFYVHHANLVGFLFVLMYIFYFNSTQPSFDSPYLNDLFCKMSEISWSMLKYLRTYSILLIAFQRFIAVYKSSLFKRISNSYLYFSMPIVCSWIISIILVVSTKLGFQTTYGTLYCIDGFSKDMDDQVRYLVVTTIL